VSSPYLSQFRISELEGFSGVKAHTIRIWEKRYNLLEPDRTGSNYRTYSMKDLTTILNVAFLVDHGLKIGKVAAMTNDERSVRVREFSSAKAEMGDTLNSLKLAMLGFDETLFRDASSACQQKEGFQTLVERVYVPLLEHIGHLWHSGSICPSQEHFVSNLIRQRIVAETDALPLARNSDRLYVMFLPDQEIHELGLLYANYLLRSFGRRTIYLGQSVPSDDLHQIAGLFSGPITYVGFITSFPAADRLQHFMNALRTQIPDPKHEFWFTGSQVNRAEGLVAPEGFRVFPHIKGMIDAFTLPS